MWSDMVGVMGPDRLGLVDSEAFEFQLGSMIRMSQYKDKKSEWMSREQPRWPYPWLLRYDHGSKTNYRRKIQMTIGFGRLFMESNRRFQDVDFVRSSRLKRVLGQTKSL